MDLVGIGVTIALAAMVMWLAFLFGRKFYDKPSLNSTSRVLEVALEARNSFWSFYIQLGIAVLIVSLIVVLLILKKIEAEAALPLMAAVGAYVLGRSAQVSQRVPRELEPPSEPNEERK